MQWAGPEALAQGGTDRHLHTESSRLILPLCALLGRSGCSDWSDTRILLYVDGRELDALELADLRNLDGQSPFLNPAYTLLNLAIGGQAGGDPALVPFPVRYEIDYVRVYRAE
jgi:hypothetical protein